MTITIGLVGASPTLDDPQSIQFDGERLRLSGLCRASSLANAAVLRDQLRGLGDNLDEPVVPILFSDSTHDPLDGLYRIDGVSVRMSETDAAMGDVAWDLQATRVTNYQSPVCESRVVMTKVSNAHGLSSTIRHEIGLPYISSEVFPQATYDPASFGTLNTGDGGAVTYLCHYPVGSGNNPFEAANGVGALQWTTSLSTWYSGSCRITVNGSTVIGRQAVDTPTSWQLSNGLVRISASATAGRWDVQWYDGSQWDAAIKFLPFLDSIRVADGFFHVGILRNGPEACTIRLGVSNTGGITCNADLTIRRGSRWVSVLFSGSATLSGIKADSTTACTAVTGGIRATSNDAGGNRFILASPAAFTSDLVNGSVRLTSASARGLFGIGCEVGGSGAASPYTAAAQILRFFGPVHETVRVVGR